MIGRILGMANKVFDRIDADKDGKVNAGEAVEAGKKRFEFILAKVDTDGDKAISKPEAKVALVGLIKRFHAAYPGGKGPGKCPMAAGMCPGKEPVKVDREAIKAAMEKRFKLADANGDGQLSREEAPARLKEHFDKVDANGDGQLTKDEIKAAFVAHHEEAAKHHRAKGHPEKDKD
jgi:Ca2+-binding EF-hand superfamily protein